MVQNFFDPARCSRCMICVERCPMKIIHEHRETGFPFVAERFFPICVRCGHCEASCPENAVTLNHPALQNVPDLQSDGVIASSQLVAYCLHRRSIRKYRPEVVERATIDELFHIVRYAPSGVNRQPLKWIVVHDRRKVRLLTNAAMEWIQDADRHQSATAVQLNFAGLLKSWHDGDDPICRGAPHLVIAHGRDADRIAAGDATIALAHLELGAPAFGLGACWAGYFTIAAGSSPKIKALLNLPEDQVVLGTMMLGYPATRYYRIPKRNYAAITWK